MEYNQPETCAKCGCLPENILMLTCNHDLCLQCSAKNYQRELLRNDKTKSIICDICGSSTLLNDSSIQELIKIFNEKIQPSSTQNYQHQRSFSNSNKKPDRPPTKPLHLDRFEKKMDRSSYKDTLPSSTKGSLNGNRNHEELNYSNIQAERPSYTNNNTVGNSKIQQRGFCFEHPEEEISYFCFDCMLNCICPECIIHGTHKNHEVKTIKKAYPIVKLKVEEILSSLDSKLNDLKIAEDNLECNRRALKDNTKNLKKQISDIFNEIRMKLDKKEKDLIKSLDQCLEDSWKELDEYLNSICNNTQEVITSYDLANNNLNARDEVLLLNFYGKNQDKLYKCILNDQLDMKKVHEIMLFKPDSNYNDIVEALHMLEIQISGISQINRQMPNSSTNHIIQSSSSNNFMISSSSSLNNSNNNNNQRACRANSSYTLPTMPNNPNIYDKKSNYRQPSITIPNDSKMKIYNTTMTNDENDETVLTPLINLNPNVKKGLDTGSDIERELRNNKNLVGPQHRKNAASLKNNSDLKNYAFTPKEIHQSRAF